MKSVLFQPLSFIEFEADYRPNATLYRIKEAKSFIPFLLFPMTRINLQWHFSCQSSSIGQFGRRQRIVLCSLICNIQLFGWMSVGEVLPIFIWCFLMRLSRFLGLYPNLEDYHTGDYFDLLNACFTSIRPQLHSSYINPEEAGRLRQLMRMNYETMHLFGMSRAERARCLAIMNDYYRLHLPDFPALKSLEVLKELFD